MIRALSRSQLRFFSVSALVVEFLAAPETELDLGAALIIEIDPQRHHRVAFTLGGADELVDLAAMEQQICADAWARG